MHHIQNIFPLLEQPVDPSFIVNPPLAHQRIIWLIRASKASQAQFALQLLAEEPEEDSFHATMATVLKLSEEIRRAWLKMEIAVAAKKVEAKMAHKKKLFTYYSIATTPAKDSIFWFKFPHQHEWTIVSDDVPQFSTLLATAAFPMVPAVLERYSRVNVGAQSVRLVQEAMSGQERVVNE